MVGFIDIDGSKYTLNAKWNPDKKKCYVDIQKDGEHYCYAPISIFTKTQKEKIYGQ